MSWSLRIPLSWTPKPQKHCCHLSVSPPASSPGQTEGLQFPCGWGLYQQKLVYCTRAQRGFSDLFCAGTQIFKTNLWGLMSSKREGLWPTPGKAQPSPSVVRNGPLPVLGHQVQLGRAGYEMDPREEETGRKLAKYPWPSPQQNGGCEGDWASAGGLRLRHLTCGIPLPWLARSPSIPGMGEGNGRAKLRQPFYVLSQLSTT